MNRKRKANDSDIQDHKKPKLNTDQISLIINTLDTPSLRELLNSIVKTYPTLPLAQLLPQPTLQSYTASLSSLKATLDQSFPYTRQGPDTSSDYAYSRTRSAIESIHTLISTRIPYFTSQDYDISWKFFFASVDTLTSLPRFSTPSHNSNTIQLIETILSEIKQLVENCGHSARNGRLVPFGTVEGWIKDLSGIADRYCSINSVLEMIRQEFGWYCGERVQVVDQTPAFDYGVRVRE